SSADALPPPLASLAFRSYLVRGLLVCLVVMRIGRDGGLGYVLGRLSLIVGHLRDATIVWQAGSVGDSFVRKASCFTVPLAGSQLLELFQAGKLAQIFEPEAQ